MAGGRSQRHLREFYGVDSAGDTFFPGPNAAAAVAGGTAPSFTGPSIANKTNAQADTVTTVFTAFRFDQGTGTGGTYSAVGLPAGLSIASASGQITGTISNGTVGGSPYSVTVTLNNSEGLASSNTFTWTVTP